MRSSIGARLLLIISSIAIAQNVKTVSATPKIDAAFGKVAVKTLLTITGTSNKELVDAAMIDLFAADSSRLDRKVIWHIQLFQQIYGIHEMTRDHSEDQDCIIAWLPKLRALSATIPKQCPGYTAEEMKEMMSQQR